MLARSLYKTFRSPNQRRSLFFSGMGRSKKAPQGAFLLVKYSAMIQYLDPNRHYTDRSYLKSWLSRETLVITDNDFETPDTIDSLRNKHSVKHCIYDITHNPYPENLLQAEHVPLLTYNYQLWYSPKPAHVFFPLFLWSFSCKNSLWWQPLKFDAGSNKTKEIMCLNHNPRSFRTQLWLEFNKREIIQHMVYTFRDPGDQIGHAYDYPLTLEQDQTAKTEMAMGIEHDVYDQCAVNLVTETSVSMPFISEKTCKPFMARQIPIILGCVGINQFLQDIGLDMFTDIVPWNTWDHEPDATVRVTRIADFVESWIRSGTILSDYQRVLARIEKNKSYFHSQEFRQLVMCQMNVAKL